MKRSGPLKRTRLKRKPRGPNRAGSNVAHLKWIKARPCCVCGFPGVQRTPTEAHHITVERGLGQKSPDDWAIPLCLGHHQMFHAHFGFFDDWGKDRRRLWQVEMALTYCPVSARPKLLELRERFTSLPIPT